MWTTLLSVAVDLFYVERATLGCKNVAREDSSSPRGNLASFLLGLVVKEEPGPVRAWGQSWPLRSSRAVLKDLEPTWLCSTCPRVAGTGSCLGRHLECLLRAGAGQIQGLGR